MSESDSEGEGGLAAAGFAPPSASASEQGSAREVSVSLRGAAVTVAQDPLAGGHHGTVWDGARALLALIDASPRRAEFRAGWQYWPLHQHQRTETQTRRMET